MASVFLPLWVEDFGGRIVCKWLLLFLKYFFLFSAGKLPGSILQRNVLFLLVITYIIEFHLQKDQAMCLLLVIFLNTTMKISLCTLFIFCPITNNNWMHLHYLFIRFTNSILFSVDPCFWLNANMDCSSTFFSPIFTHLFFRLIILPFTFLLYTVTLSLL